MESNNSGFFTSLWRLVTFYNWRQAWKMRRAGDKLFTETPDGMRAGFAIAEDNLVARYNRMKEAMVAILRAQDTKEQLLKQIREKIATTTAERDGALTAIEQARKANDKAAEDEAAADAAKYQQEIDELEEQEKAKEADLQTLGPRVADLKREMQALKDEKDRLPDELAMTLADAASDDEVIRRFNELSNMKADVDKGPLDAIRAARKEKAAEARVATQIGGIETGDKRKKYADLGAKSGAADRIEQMLKKRAADRGEATGEAPVEQAERPKA